MFKTRASGINVRKNEAKDFEMNTQETELQCSSGSETEYQCDNYSPLYNGNVRKFVPDVEAQATAPDEPAPPDQNTVYEPI